jgi:hypothetical protein
MFFIILLILWTSFILVVATSHIQRSSGLMALTVSSVTLFTLTAFTMFMCGSHKCDEGGTPLSVIVTTGVLAASLPWVLRGHPWLLRGIVAAAIFVGANVASKLTHSYHRDDITGNPRHASGRFWHTPLTGKYPRDEAYTLKAQFERERQQRKKNTTNSEP